MGLLYGEAGGVNAAYMGALRKRDIVWKMQAGDVLISVAISEECDAVAIAKTMKLEGAF